MSAQHFGVAVALLAMGLLCNLTIRCPVPQVNVEVAMTARYWTKIFTIFVFLSYGCAYLFMFVYM